MKIKIFKDVEGTQLNYYILGVDPFTNLYSVGQKNGLSHV